jgi:hypothetical protein
MKECTVQCRPDRNNAGGILAKLQEDDEALDACS